MDFRIPQSTYSVKNPLDIARSLAAILSLGLFIIPEARDWPTEVKVGAVVVAVVGLGWKNFHLGCAKIHRVWKQVTQYARLQQEYEQVQALVDDFPRREREAINEGRWEVMHTLYSITATVKGPIAIQGIGSKNGTVELHLDRGSRDGVQPSQLMLVRRAFDREVWGIVQVIEVNDGTCRAVPVDRKNPEFWERLEDRMDYDPTPPPSVQVDTYTIAELRSLIGM